MSSPEDERQSELVASLRSVRDAAREAPDQRAVLPGKSDTTQAGPALPRLDVAKTEVEPEKSPPASPERADVNTLWNIADAFTETPKGFLGRLLSPLRQALQRMVRFALGPVVERQVQMNSAQVRFDNEVVSYIDMRIDRMTSHYDQVLGLHGKRMEEIDERHLILQQELVRHVHDLVERIEFVFETAETNHLQIDGSLRETREQLRELVARIEALGGLDSLGGKTRNER